MDETPASTTSVDDLLAASDAPSRLEELAEASVEERKATLQELRAAAADRPEAVAPLAPALERFLTDDARPVRLVTAKTLVAVADADPGAVVDLVPALADRLADPDEFYYVRARSAEALGLVALEHADAVASPDVLADLRIGLSFDADEVRRKLAKALECVALGDSSRLAHLVDSLGEHLSDDDERVRYHCTTALAVVGCERPDALAPLVDALEERLADDSPHVRGRAAEALGLVAGADDSEADVDAIPERALGELAAEPDELDESEATDDEVAAARFAAERARFALGRLRDDEVPEADADRKHGDVGTVAGVRESTGPALAAIETPDGEPCPHCGEALPSTAPPTCPRCGAPLGR